MAILRWICAATARNVQELVLRFRLDEPFELPVCVSTCESLRVLKLDLSEAILKLPSYLGFCQLKFLHLVNVVLSDKHLTSCLFSKCPLLEKVILRDCSLGTMTMLDISSTSLLYLYLVDASNRGDSYSSCTIKISCPNLKLLKYSAPMPKDIIMENLLSIEVVRIFLYDTHFIFEEIGMLVLKMIKYVPSTTKLKLCMVSIRGLHRVVVHGVRNSLFTFNNLKSLKLDVGIEEGCMQGMILLLKHSPNLEFLHLWSDENDGWDENWKLYDPNETIVCLESHLKVIRLTDFKYEENEMELLRFFLKNAPVLEKMTIVLASYAEKYEEASEVVLKYPRASSHVVVTFLDDICSQNYVNRYYQV